MSRPQGHIATGRIKKTKYSNNPIENRTRDIPACSAVPLTPYLIQTTINLICGKVKKKKETT